MTSGVQRLWKPAVVLAVVGVSVVIAFMFLPKALPDRLSVAPPGPSVAHAHPAPIDDPAVLAGKQAVERLKQEVLTSPYGKMPIDKVVGRFLEAEGPSLERLYLTLALRKKEALPIVIASLRTGPPHHQRKLTKILRYLGWSEAIPVLLELATSDEQHWLARTGSLYALGAIGDKSVGARIIGLLNKPNRSLTEKRIIMAVLARLECHEAVPAIRPYLDHENVLVRVYATRALAELGEQPNIDAVLKASEDKDYVIRDEACGALGSCSDAAAVQRLNQLAEADPIRPVRRQARIGLFRMQMSKMPDAQRADLLKGLLTDSDKRITDWAVSTLATRCGAAGRSALERIASQSSLVGRRAAFYLLILPGASADFSGGNSK